MVFLCFEVNLHSNECPDSALVHVPRVTGLPSENIHFCFRTPLATPHSTDLIVVIKSAGGSMQDGRDIRPSWKRCCSNEKRTPVALQSPES
jgi:hypothetical protein